MPHRAAESRLAAASWWDISQPVVSKADLLARPVLWLVKSFAVMQTGNRRHLVFKPSCNSGAHYRTHLGFHMGSWWHGGLQPLVNLRDVLQPSRLLFTRQPVLLDELLTAHQLSTATAWSTVYFIAVVQLQLDAHFKKS